MTNASIEVIWDGDSSAVVLKPAGLATQAPAPHRSLETVLRDQFSHRSTYLAFPHRLDRPVSGLILIAFTKKAARLLGEQFEARRIHKTYLALVEGVVGESPQTWSDVIRKLDDEARVEVLAHEADQKNLQQGKSAELQMKVNQVFGSRSLIELSPTTGRMHQIRVQAAFRGHAIVGDTLYGSTEQIAQNDGDTIALHAWKLEFNDPANGRRVTVQSPIPQWAKF